MAELRALAEELGLEEARTYVASGNLVFGSDEAPAKLERKLEQAIEGRFGFAVDVIVRSAEQWADYCANNPFPDESRRAPNFVMLVLGREPPDEAAVDALRARASAEEKVERRGDTIWIWFGNGSGRSKIGTGPAKGVWTSRNWRTVLALQDMLA
jgi:uncharacterized protein (DUF1697 family)